MVESIQSEKKTPVTIFQTNIEGKIFQFVVESESVIEHCFMALNQFIDHVNEIKKKIEEKSQEEKKNE
jgi:mevalonate kinase